MQDKGRSAALALSSRMTAATGARSLTLCLNALQESQPNEQIHSLETSSTVVVVFLHRHVHLLVAHGHLRSLCTCRNGLGTVLSSVQCLKGE